ncbi:MAG: 3'-5' exonuclease, partial [Chitinophagales bacterium]|nr:3'-5' exonuclease [Chitinophagales bacterium]
MYAIVDIETTGTNASYNCITEVAIYIHNGEKIVDEWHSLINPQSEIPNFIIQMTGISNEMVETAPTFEEVAPEIFSMLHDKIFVAHNAGFDYGFLKNHLGENGFELRTKKLCTVRLSRKIFPGHRSYS